jgi:hypothetical protein
MHPNRFQSTAMTATTRNQVGTRVGVPVSVASVCVSGEFVGFILSFQVDSSGLRARCCREGHGAKILSQVVDVVSGVGGVVVQECAGDQPGFVEETQRTLETGSVTVADTVGVSTELGEVSETTG